MDRRRWYAAAAFGLLNTAFFGLTTGGVGVILLANVGILALLLALAIVGAAWSLEAAEDLTRISARDAAALLVRGTMAGSMMGAIVAAVAFGVEDVGNAFYGSLFGGFFGLFAGLACAILDVAVLGGVRLGLQLRGVNASKEVP